MFARRISAREVSNLTAHIPDGDGIWAAAGTDRAWSSDGHQLAYIRDLLAAGNWQRSGSESNPRPKPVTRPAQARIEAAEAADRQARREAKAQRWKARQTAAE